MTTGTTAEADWLVEQLAAWPRRVDREKTTNVEYLTHEAAKRIKALEEALRPFAEAARNGGIAGRPPFEFCAASDYERAAALIHGGGHG